eukprot:10399835-Karenia_brevis.AAC.1
MIARSSPLSSKKDCSSYASVVETIEALGPNRPQRCPYGHSCSHCGRLRAISFEQSRSLYFTCCDEGRNSSTLETDYGHQAH